MFLRCGLSLLVLSMPLALAAKPKGDGLTQKEIVDVIRQHDDDARACYKETLDKDKTAEGQVKIRFLIGLNGKIEASEIEKNTFKDKAVGKCLSTKMKAWTFPKPRGQERVSIAYPFEFKTAPAPAAPPAPPVPADAAVPPAPGVAPAAPEAPPAPPAPPAGVNEPGK